MCGKAVSTGNYACFKFTFLLKVPGKLSLSINTHGSVLFKILQYTTLGQTDSMIVSIDIVHSCSKLLSGYSGGEFQVGQVEVKNNENLWKMNVKHSTFKFLYANILLKNLQMKYTIEKKKS